MGPAIAARTGLEMAEHVRDFWGRVHRLAESQTPFATATVVARLSPVSSHLGDRALIFADGQMEGFVGGACSREVVRRHALETLRTGRPRLLKIRPDATPPELGQDGASVTMPMTCASEGAADIYLEPHLPPRLLVVVGYTPVASTLAQLASVVEYRVVRVVDAGEIRDTAQDGVDVVSLDDLPRFVHALADATRARMVAVVASQGHYDDVALQTLIRSGASYIGLLASRKRGAGVLATLARLADVSGAALAPIKTPIGIDIGAKTPGEVAVSILAEIIAHRIAAEAPSTAAAGIATEQTHPGGASSATAAIDPVCAMEVEIESAKHVATHAARAYYFCCAQCKAEVLKDPAHYLATTA
jgi:xanthine dehydrogenase accessory factor